MFTQCIHSHALYILMTGNELEKVQKSPMQYVATPWSCDP